MVASGEDVKTVQGILRHAHSKTTLDLYAQSMEATKLAAQGRYLLGWGADSGRPFAQEGVSEPEPSSVTLE